MSNQALSVQDELLTPTEIEEEQRLARRAESAFSISRMAYTDPERVVQMVTSRAAGLWTLRAKAIEATEPHDWVINKDREGHELAILKKSGCSKVRQYFGISTINIRPTEIKITTVEGKDGKKYLMAEVWGDGHSSVTGETISNVRGARSTNEQFIGRDSNQLSDLKEAARTNLDNKICRILGGMTQVSRAELDQAWGSVGKSSKDALFGHGFGASKDRGSDGGADSRQQLIELIELLAPLTGKTEQELFKEATYWENKKTKKSGSFSRMDQLKQSWQITQAIDKLKAAYGDLCNTPPPDPEPGSDEGEEGGAA